MEGFGTYTFELVSRWITQHPSSQFILLYDRTPKHPLPALPHVQEVILPPATRHPLLYWFWFEIQVPRALKKHKVDLFYSPDGYNSLRINIPTVLTIHDLNFMHNPQDVPRILQLYLSYFFPRFAHKAKKIITVSTYSKEDILACYGIESSKVSVVYNAASETYKPLAEGDQKAIRAKYTQGKPYFIFIGSLHPRKNVQRLINAYNTLISPTVELVIVGSPMWKGKGLKTAGPHEKKIHFTGYLPQKEAAQLMASAEALTYIPYFEGFGIPLVEALQCEVPILAANATCLPEIAGDAALYCDPYREEDIATGLERMMVDAGLRRQLIKAGKTQKTLYHWDKAANTIWSIFETTVGT
jgi:glycosyltransferase involved in cell wall biosynthesis